VSSKQNLYSGVVTSGADDGHDGITGSVCLASSDGSGTVVTEGVESKIGLEVSRRGKGGGRGQGSQEGEGHNGKDDFVHGCDDSSSESGGGE
jgi:hypothetical protein